MNSKLIAAWVWLQNRGERGATAVEYGMLVALIAAVIIAIVATVGTDVEAAFKKIADKL
jgi:pilus assembly protein Flp/PilA